MYLWYGGLVLGAVECKGNEGVPSVGAVCFGQLLCLGLALDVGLRVSGLSGIIGCVPGLIGDKSTLSEMGQLVRRATTNMCLQAE